MADARTVTLSRSLPGFVEPDTRSATEGRVPAGNYALLELLPNRGDESDDDYARIAIEGLDGDDTWICIRSGASRFGEVLEHARPRADRTEPIGDPDAVPEKALLALLPQFRDFRYAKTDAHYPFAIRGCGLPQAPPQRNNCCTFVEALLVGAWQAHHPDRFAWSPGQHKQMMIIGNDLFSPIHCLVEAGIATAFDGAALTSVAPPPWAAIQGWRSDGGGHTFLIVDHHAQSDRVLTLESNRGFGLDGVGFRRLGNLRDLADNEPPDAWWENAAAPTWASICALYPEREMAGLKVTERSWSGLRSAPAT
jgi:hypothetical protein